MERKKPDQEFLPDAVRAIGRSPAVSARALRMLRKLTAADPFGLTKFEFSFKAGAGRISPVVRFLNIDADAYSCRDKDSFLRRLELCRGIMADEGQAKKNKSAVDALKLLADTPMDLYFGADLDRHDCLFAFWLVFGGVKKNGAVSFWPYDFEGLIGRLLKKLKLREPPQLGKDILNFGLDLGRETTYKLYYLCRDSVMPGSIFTGLMKEINARLKPAKYFYFFSRMYDRDGRMLKEKLFIEFLEDIYNHDLRRLNRVLNGLAGVSGIKLDVKKTAALLAQCGGRISLVSFEPDGTLTVYMRNR